MRATLAMILMIPSLTLFADENAPPVPCAPATAPATRPTIPPPLQARIDELVAQLGDNAFEKREAAMGKLKEIGESARVALQTAAKSKDAEVAERAARLLAALDGRDDAPDDAPFVRPGGGVIQIFGGGMVAGNVTVSVISIDGMKLTRRNDATGLHVTHEVTDAKGKKTVTKADAKDMAELKKKHPKLHALIEKHFGKGGPVQQLRIRFGVGRMAPPVPQAPPGAPATARLVAALARIGIRGRELDAASCGKLKVKAGILVDGVLGAKQGAVLLGVRRGDVIVAINGRPLASATDAVAASRRPLRSLTVIRGGERMQLTPPPPPPPGGENERGAIIPPPIPIRPPLP